MKKVLMVCLGNICRSPMAEGILRKKLEDNGIKAFVDSAGTSGWHSGDSPDPRAMEECMKNDIDITNLIGRQFTTHDFKKFDLIFTMDESNFTNVISISSSQEEKIKVAMILNEIEPGLNLSVPDPYYGDDDGFTNVYNMLDRAAEAIILKYFV